MNEQTVVVLWFVAGASLSVVLPFTREWLASKAAFDWRKLVGQGLAVVAVVAAQVVGLSEQLGGATAVIAFAAGMGVSFAGRQGQKVADAYRQSRS